MRNRRLFQMFLLILLLGASPLIASAQAQPEAVVLFTSAEEQDTSLALRIQFTMVDENGQLLPKDAVKIENGGTVQLLTGASQPVTATIEPATAPIKIALVLDASGSMARSIASVRDAAIKFVNAVPINADVGVFSFSNDLLPQLEFTNKSSLERIEAAIRRIDIIRNPQPNTCFYQASYDAMKALEAAQGDDPAERRAVVLFTDGLDNEIPEVGCAAVGEQDVVAEATQSGRVPIQIHTIGLCQDSCDRVDGPKLKALSEQTKASSVTGPPDQLDAMFATIVSVLDSQWVAATNVLPPRGDNKANLSFAASVRDIPRTYDVTTDTFESANDYTDPSAGVEILQPSYDSATDAYSLTLRLSNAPSIASVSVQAVDKDGGTTVGEPVTSEAPAASVPVTISANSFTAEREYCFRVSANQVNGGELRNADGGTVIAETCIKHLPRMGINITERTYDTASGVYSVKVALDNPGAVRQITLVAVDRAANITVGAPITRQDPGATVDLEQPTAGFIAGKEYCTRITALDRNGVDMRKDSDITVAESCGVFDPATEKTFGFSMTSGDTSPDQTALVVNLDVQRASEGQSLAYRGFVNQGTRRVTDIGEELLKSNRITIALPMTETTRLLAQNGPSEYTVNLTVLEPGKPDASITLPFAVTTTPPVRLTFIQRLGLAFLNPFVLAGLLLILVAGAGVIWYSRQQKKPRNRTDPLQPPPSPYSPLTQHLDSRKVDEAVAANAARSGGAAIAMGAATELGSATVLGDIGGATQIELDPHLRVTVMETLDPSQKIIKSFSSFPCILGRGGSSDRVDLVITGDSKISRAHARIDLIGGVFTIMDLRSTNGTYVGDTRLEQGGSAQITGRTEVGLGRYTKLMIEPMQ